MTRIKLPFALRLLCARFKLQSLFLEIWYMRWEHIDKLHIFAIQKGKKKDYKNTPFATPRGDCMRRGHTYTGLCTDRLC